MMYLSALADAGLVDKIEIRTRLQCLGTKCTTDMNNQSRYAEQDPPCSTLSLSCCHGSVQQALQSYFSWEVVTDDNCVTCANCGGKEATRLRIELLSLPRFFVLHLKRFQTRILSNYAGNEMMKNTNRLKIEREIFATTAEMQGTYHLTAIMCHAGTLNSGHYWTVLVDPGSNELLQCNDSVLNKIKTDALESPKIETAAYILFYKQGTVLSVNPSKIATTTVTIPASKKPNRDPSTVPDFSSKQQQTDPNLIVDFKSILKKGKCVEENAKSVTFAPGTKAGARYPDVDDDLIERKKNDKRCLRRNPKQKRFPDSWECQAPINKRLMPNQSQRKGEVGLTTPKTCSLNTKCGKKAINDLPQEVLLIILVEHVLNVGDIAFQLRQVSLKWRDTMDSHSFARQHHLSWIESIRGVSNIDCQEKYLQPYSFTHCEFCGCRYKTRPIGYQGHGKRGQTTGWYEDPVFPGACCAAHYFE